MSAERFETVAVNPNDNVGGGGCLCSEDRVVEAEGPYTVFYVQDMASNISPVPVICAGCLRAAAEALEGEVLAGGEEAIELPPENVTETDSDDEPILDVISVPVEDETPEL